MKRLCIIGLCLLLCGCTHRDDLNKATVSTPQPSTTPEVTAKPENQSNSLSPNDVTDYDREAVTALINMDLIQKYGKDVVFPVVVDQVNFTKDNGVVTATGSYSYRDSNNTKTLDFTYTYQDENTQYSLLSSNTGDTNDAQDTQAPVPDDDTSTTTINDTPTKSYTVNINKTITVNINHQGDGSFIVRLADESGKIVKELINETGATSTSVSYDVDTPDTYELQIFTTDGSWSVNYSLS